MEGLRAHGAELIDLCESNPTRCGFEYPEQEIAAALGSADLRRYEPDPKGLGSARSAVSEALGASGAQVPPEQIVLCSGTSEGYAFLLKLLCNAGDNVLVPSPSYPLLDFLAELESVEVRQYPLQWDSGEWAVDLGALKAAFDARSRAVLAINPGHPTGAFLKGAELTMLDHFCAERGCPLISDEVFFDYPLTESALRARTALAGEGDCLRFVLSGLSKMAGLPHLKLSWVCAAGPSTAVDEAVARLEIVADTYLSTSPILQAALPRLLQLAPRIRRQIRSRILENRAALLAARPANAEWTILPSEGGWSGLVQLPESSDEEATCLQLLDRGAILQPGYFFDFPRGKFLVLSLIVPRDSLERGLEILRSVLAR
jgi:aspartate/methionine/tyrosine aminotransferase